MVRRLQLMEPERRSFGSRVAEAIGGLRDGLLRDNKVLPPVLAALALIIFAWLLAGVIIGDPSEEDRVARQAAQPSVAQAPEDGAGSGTPAPGVENRDNEALDVFESKDPFRELIPPADAGGGDTTGSDTGTSPPVDDGTGSGTGSDPGTGTGDGTDSGSGTGSDGGDDFLDQTSPGDSGFDDGSGNGNGGNGGGGNGGGSGNGGSGGGSGNGGGSGQYDDGDGNGNLFDSGGGLGR